MRCGLLEGGVGGTVGVESCGRIRCPFPGKSRRSIETCIMAAIIHFLSDRGDLLYGGCSVHASPSLSPYRRICIRHRFPRAPFLLFPFLLSLCLARRLAFPFAREFARRINDWGKRNGMKLFSVVPRVDSRESKRSGRDRL